MKHTILTLALTLGVPALVATAQPAAPDSYDRGPQHAPSAAAPDHARGTVRDERGTAREDRAPARDEAAPLPPRDGFRAPDHRPDRADMRGADREEGFRRDGAPAHRPPAPALIAALDANHDGVIDAKELENAIDVLKKLDKNKDGVLTPDEFMGEFMGPRHHRFWGGPEARDEFRPPRGARGPEAWNEDRGPGHRMGFGPESRFADRGPGRGMPGGPDARFDDRGPGRGMPGGPDARFDDRGPGRGMPGAPGHRPPMMRDEAPSAPAAPARPDAPQNPPAPRDDARE